MLFGFILIGESKAQSQSEINSGFEWLTLDEAQIKAKETGKNILLFGYAEWCTYCLKMRKESFPDSTVQKAIADYYYPVQLNGESEERVTWNGKKMPAVELARYLRLSSFPTHYFINSEGEILGAQPGFIEADIYSPLLNYVGSGAFGNMGFEEFLEKEEKTQENK
tara:strand:- start:13901 stop:14398 length:498 start_codon:yes stop_codon:yes gene_type:complete